MFVTVTSTLCFIHHLSEIKLNKWKDHFVPPGTMSDIENQESESCWKTLVNHLDRSLFSRASGLDVKEMVSKAAIILKIIIIGSSCHP